MSAKRKMSRFDKEIEKIAMDHLGIATLEVRNRDSLDFHDCGVASIRAALEAAYFAGQESGMRLGSIATA